MRSFGSIQEVLVTDDDPGVLSSYRAAIARRGWSALLAARGDDTLRIALQRRPQLAIVDYRLPDMSGIELINELTTKDPDLTAVMVTGYGSMELVVQALRVGAHDVVTKPVGFGELMQRITGRYEINSVKSLTAERAEWEHFHRVLADCGNNLSEAARVLRVSRAKLRRTIRKTAPV